MWTGQNKIPNGPGPKGRPFGTESCSVHAGLQPKSAPFGTPKLNLGIPEYRVGRPYERPSIALKTLPSGRPAGKGTYRLRYGTKQRVAANVLDHQVEHAIKCTL